MKKYFMFALAATAMLSATSCFNEKDLDLAPKQELSDKEGVGYISLNVSSDDEMATRAIHGTNVTGEYHLDASNWTVSVSGTTTYNGTVSGLANHSFSAATGYTVTASNYANLKAALAANGNFGDAFYKGTSSAFAVTAGGTATPEIVCGKAQNARLKITLGSLTGITINSITVVGDDGEDGETPADEEDRTVTFHNGTTDNTEKFGYFKANDELTYNITYTTNNKKYTYSNKITLAASTSNTLSLASTDTGLITLTITYNDEFGTDQDQTKTVTIDAATGSATVTPAS